jgi:transcriptional regulator with XRE-family HTH domain
MTTTDNNQPQGIPHEIGDAALGVSGLDLQRNEQVAGHLRHQPSGGGGSGGDGQNVHAHTIHLRNARVKPLPGESVGLHSSSGGPTLLAKGIGDNMPSENPTAVSTPSIGQCLSAWRHLRGLSQEEAAARAGLSRNTVNRSENGHLNAETGKREYDVRHSTLVVLAQVYGAPSVAALLQPPGAMPAPASPEVLGVDALGLATLMSPVSDTMLVPVFRGVPQAFDPSDPAFVRMEGARITWGAQDALVYIILTDDSCYPLGRDGALVAINLSERKPPSQRPVLVELPDGKRAIRYYVREGGGAWVEPINKAWGPAVPIEAGVAIMGRVKAWIVEER